MRRTKLIHVRAAESYCDSIAEHGFAIMPRCIDEATCERVIDELNTTVAAAVDDSAVRRRQTVFAVRNLFEIVPSLQELLRHEGVRHLVEPILTDQAFCVRAILLDKKQIRIGRLRGTKIQRLL